MRHSHASVPRVARHRSASSRLMHSNAGGFYSGAREKRNALGSSAPECTKGRLAVGPSSFTLISIRAAGVLHPFAVCRGRPIQLSAVALVNLPELAHSEPEQPWDYCAASEVAPTELRWRLMSAGRECRTLWSAAAARIRCQGSGGRRKVTPRSADETSPLHPWRGNSPLLLPSLLPYDG
jgi:hypothetical protein